MCDFLKDGLSQRKYIWYQIRTLLMLGIFEYSEYFRKTSLQMLSDSDGVMMRFGTKIFIFTAYVFSQILRLHANCAYAFSNVKDNQPQNTSEKFRYMSTSLTLQISQ